ncbi:hypothetical protein ACWGH8_28265 [Nonomuraea muscovyensis]
MLNAEGLPDGFDRAPLRAGGVTGIAEAWGEVISPPVVIRRGRGAGLRSRLGHVDA